MNKLSVTVPTLILLTAAFAAHSVANPQNQPPSRSLSSHEAQFTAISVVRTINSAEAGYAFSTKRDSSQPCRRYATWPELYASGIFEEMKRSTPKVLSLMNADGVEGYNLALIVSPDGQSYELALHDANPQSAGFSVFSDQGGLIYTGSPLQ